jgi:hypothetical protein
MLEHDRSETSIRPVYIARYMPPLAGRNMTRQKYAMSITENGAKIMPYSVLATGTPKDRSKKFHEMNRPADLCR